MAQTVYIETTIVSYLTAWPSRDITRAGQQQTTRDWWATQRSRFHLYTSPFVVLEASAGDASAAEERLNVLAGLQMLQVTEEALKLARPLIERSALPSVALRDAEHVGVSAANGIDFLLTWNCRHLANAVLQDRIAEVCEEFSFCAPRICTPEELFGDPYDQSAD